MTHWFYDQLKKTTEDLFWNNTAIQAKKKETRKLIETCGEEQAALQKQLDHIFEDSGYAKRIAEFEDRIEELHKEFNAIEMVRILNGHIKDRGMDLEAARELDYNLHDQKFSQESKYVQEWLETIKKAFQKECAFMGDQLFNRVWEAATAHIDTSLGKFVRIEQVKLIPHTFCTALEVYARMNIVELP